VSSFFVVLCLKTRFFTTKWQKNRENLIILSKSKQNTCFMFQKVINFASSNNKMIFVLGDKQHKHKIKTRQHLRK